MMINQIFYLKYVNILEIENSRYNLLFTINYLITIIL